MAAVVKSESRSPPLMVTSPRGTMTVSLRSIDTSTVSRGNGAVATVMSTSAEPGATSASTMVPLLEPTERMRRTLPARA